MSSSPAKAKSTRKRDKFKSLFKDILSPSLPSSSGKSHDRTNDISNPNVPQTSTQANLVETLQISGRFAQSILPSLAGCVDANPAKTAFNILNVIVDVRKKINDNKDELQAVLEETLKLLSTVFAKMEVSSNSQSVVNQTIEQYKREISEQLERIQTINMRLHSNVFCQVDYENYKVQLTDISRKIGGATNRFNTAMAGSTGIIVDELRDEKREEKLRQDLQPSEVANHRFIHDGKSALKREVCTEGTRVDILNEISEWANDSSAGNPPVFWLTGQAGSGKTTIAFTITKRFEKDQPTVLGANFLCSRQFRQTRSLQRIVPTIAFQLARNCEPYRSALLGINTSEAVHSYSVHEQVEKFLFRPWKQRKHVLGLPTYLIVVDALDEIEEVERYTFLEEILKSIEANHITGLRFLVTSRPDPDIVKLCKTFPPGAVCQLQNVPIENAKLDIKTYLDIKLKYLHGTPEVEELNTRSAGLFIYAATVVKILTGRKLVRSEQLKRLRSLFSSSSSDFGSIDELYQQIMRDAFADLDDDPELLSARLCVLHTFLYSIERISPFVAASLLDTDIEVARIVLDNLHAVLYVKDGLVYWYHASFPDFILGRTRSNFQMDGKDFAFSCDAAARHIILSHGCFRVMKSKDIGLRFNMGNIKSSYLLDHEHAEELHENVDKNISPVLRYSCIHWAHHLTLSPEADDGNICDVISDFLCIGVLFWIEAMNLLGSSGDCSHLLQNAGRWVSKIKNNPALAKHLQEVSNFAMHFSGGLASESTPHLYISSLATWQSTSIFSKHWKNEFPGIPLYKHTKGIIAVPLMTKRVNYLVYAITFSNDGKQVVVGMDTAAVVLDATTGRQQRLLSEAKGCYLVKFSWDGTRLVTVSAGMLDIWDTSNFQLLKKSDVDYATISIEGTQILTVSSRDADGHYHLEVLDISKGTLLRILKMISTEDYSFYKMAFSSVAKRFLVLSNESVGIWDIPETDSVLKEPIMLDGHTSFINGIALSPNGEQVATGSSDTSLRVWDASTGNVSMVLPHKNKVLELDFSSDGTRIVSATMDGTLHVWDAVTGVQLRVLDTDADLITSVAFSRDGSRICAGSDKLYVCPWEESTQVKEIHDIHDSNSDAQDNGIGDIRISDDCKNIISATSDTVHIWDAATGAELRAIPCPDMHLRKLSGNGENIVSCLLGGSLVVLDLITGDTIMHLERKADYVIRCIALSGSGRNFAIIRGTSLPDETSNHYLLEIWNVENGQEIEIILDDRPLFLAFSNDEQHILCGMARIEGSACIIVRNVLTGHITHQITSQRPDTDGIRTSFSSNGREAVICTIRLSKRSTSDFLLELWDILSGKLLKVVKASYKTTSYDGEHAPFRWVYSLALSNNGEKIAVSCSDGFIRIWDIVEDATGVIIGFAGISKTITFSRDDKQIVSGSSDGSVCVWDLDTGKYDWILDDSGWITSQKKEHRLMWVSEFLRVIPPCNILIISSRGHGAVEFEKALIGEDWEKCYTARNSIPKDNNLDRN